MAIIIRGKTLCPLCGEVLTEEDEIFATSHFISDKTDPLWCFSDAALHRQCFLNWDKKEEFRAKFNEIVANLDLGSGLSHYMEPDGTIIEVKKAD